MFSKRNMSNLKFDNSALRILPVDPIKENYVREVPSACFSRVSPTPVENPRLVAFSEDALKLLELDLEEVKKPEFAEYMSGNKNPPGSDPSAHCYCGHQFGNFAGQLGDGRAISLGEVVNSKGERWEIQLKGAGKTPYSRDADGRAVLRSSIREFLCSEALFYLGIPTTRAGTLVISDSLALRDPQYSGHVIQEKCCIVTRIAPSFMRFGSFEIFKDVDPLTRRRGPSVGDTKLKKKMLDYIIEYHFPEIHNSNVDEETKYTMFYTEVVKRTAILVAEWQAVGFCHGVLNTDNLSILGLTIDYGPFGFMDAFNPDHICNGSDHDGRYSYKNQPKICKWNLEKFAEALSDLLPLSKSAKELEKYDEIYSSHYYSKMRKKLGLQKNFGQEDKDIIDSFMNTMKVTGADFTNSFRGLNKIHVPTHDDDDCGIESFLQYILHQVCSAQVMAKMHAPIVSKRELEMLITLVEREPSLLYVLGKSPEFVQQQIQQYEKFEKMKEITQEQKAESDKRHWVEWLYKYKQRLFKELDDSTHIPELNKNRKSLMNRNNPKFVLRNYTAQNCIEKAEKGDFEETKKVLELLKDPFQEGTPQQSCEYTKLPPSWAQDLCVTCSS